jgi:hypothetical protein
VGNAGKPVRTFAVSMNSGSISITIPDSPR